MMGEVKERSQPEILKEISEGLGQAVGAASQLIHSGGNPAFWLTIRQALELTKEGCMALAPTAFRLADPAAKKFIV